MRRYRPTKHDLDHVPWAESHRDEIPRFTTELYYGRLSITHFDGDGMLRIGRAVVEYLTDLLPERERGRIRVAWVHHVNGREFLSAVMDKATGRWRRPVDGLDHG